MIFRPVPKHDKKVVGCQNTRVSHVHGTEWAKSSQAAMNALSCRQPSMACQAAASLSVACDFHLA